MILANLRARCRVQYCGVGQSPQRQCGRFEEEMPNMMTLWSSCIREQKGAEYFAGQPANTHPLRHWRL
jgi:hypothetical protein